MRRTKIVCTIGPASAAPSTMRKLLQAGMCVARLNFSHGTHQQHTGLIRSLRSVAKERTYPLALLGDLQGPKIRVGDLPEEGVQLPTGSEVTFSTASKTYKPHVLPVTYANLHKDVKKGQRILMDDGLLEAVVVSVRGRSIKVKIKNGGKLTSHKGMNFPDSNLRISSITDKDKKDIAFAVKRKVDWIALSFVTSPGDIRLLRRLMKKAAKPGQLLPRIVVKIEKHEAIERFDAILEEADGVMVARGDLGIEIPAAEVPIWQKRIIGKCRQAGKPVIVATQMLDSMIRNPRPTRAEVSDVANAVFDHADAVMLSGESATGNYPVESVQAMASIIDEAEASQYDDVVELEKIDRSLGPLPPVVKGLADRKLLDAVVSCIDLVPEAEYLPLSRPEIPVFIGASTAGQARQLNLFWGVQPFRLSRPNSTTFARRSVKYLRDQRQVKKGMRLALVPGGSHGEGFDLVEVA